MTISVVIPTYNRAVQVVHAIESAMTQTAPPLEIIVVDDGSSDGTVAAVSTRFTNCPLVRVISLHSNQGACAARNIGIHRATGAFVAFLDSDDLWMPEKLHLQTEALKANPTAAGSFTGYDVVRHGRRLETRMPPAIVDETRLKFNNLLGSTSVAVVRRSCLLEIGGFDPTLQSCQDWDLYLKVLATGSMAVVQRSLAQVDDGPHNRISTDRDASVQGHRAIRKRVVGATANAALRADLDLYHRFKEADVIARAGKSYGEALSLGVDLTLNHVRPAAFLYLAKLAYRIGVDVWRNGGWRR